MGYSKDTRPRLTRGDRAYPVQALTATGTYSTATQVAGTINQYGVTTIQTSGSGAGPWVFTLPAPIPGVTKVVAIQQNSSLGVTLQTNSSGTVIFGTTYNNILMSTGAYGTTDHRVATYVLVGVSTAAWALPAGKESTAASITVAAATQAV